MTQLVISVRSAAEAVVAAENGADIVDVKEPQRGSMGAADGYVLNEVQAAVPTATLSFAAGELIDIAKDAERAGVAQTVGAAETEAVRRSNEVCVANGFSFAKAAPAGCSSLAEWQRAWSIWTANLAQDIRKVAVVYADAESAASPVPEVLLPHAIESGAHGILFDTHAKRGGGLFDVLSATHLSQWVKMAHGSGVWVCFAGSLRNSDIGLAAECGCDFVAFRTAACRGGRLGTIDAASVSALAESVSVCS